MAHAQVFGHIAEFLTAIESGTLGAMGDWSIHVPAWIAFCRWSFNHRLSLNQRPGLELFDRAPKDAEDHPIYRMGVTRHGVVTALWNRHQLADAYPPSPSLPSAQRYFYLQAQLLKSYIDARWKLCPLDFYESYSAEQERPIAPALTGEATLAIREFSHNRYDQFLGGLVTASPTPEFHRDLFAMYGDLKLLDIADQARGGRYLAALKRYFRGSARVMAGKRPVRASRKGGGGGGGHARRPGYIHIDVPGVYIDEPPPVIDDPDFPQPLAVSAWIDTDFEPDEDSKGVELSGLAPDETLEPVFSLVDAENYRAGVQGEHFRRLAIEMAAQAYPWSYHKLTGGELVTLWNSLEQAIFAYYDSPKNLSRARYFAITALVLKFSLLFGQPIEGARNLKIQWLSPDEPFDPDDPPEITAAMCFARRGETDSDAPQFLGFGLPAIGPAYKTELDETLEEFSRPLALGIVLPNISNLGDDLLKFLATETRPNERVFGIDPGQLDSFIKQLLGGLDARISPDKIVRVLATEVLRRTGDLSLAWLVTADANERNQPRLFYTRHSLRLICGTYAKAATGILRRVWSRPLQYQAPEPAPLEMLSVGARFVLKTDELKALIKTLKAMLTDWRREPLARQEIVEYNDAYLFYTALMQSLMTSIRAIRKPVSVLADWTAADGPRADFLSSLSDKESRYFDKSRPVEVAPELAMQFKNYRQHVQALVKRLGLRSDLSAKNAEDQLLIVVTAKKTIEPLTPSWITQQFEHHLGAKIPANFHRAFLRTSLLERGVPAEIVDAFLGHSNVGESPFGLFSSFDYGQALTTLTSAIRTLASELGLVPVESRLVPYPTRLGLQ